MKWASFGLFIGQLALVIVGAKASPDYYVRSAGSVLTWAYSRGLWILISNVALTLALAYLAKKTSWRPSKAIFIISLLLSLVWLTYPYAYSIIGDLVFFRFP